MEENTSCVESLKPCPQIPNSYWKGKEALGPPSALRAVVDHTRHKELGGKPSSSIYQNVLSLCQGLFL